MKKQILAMFIGLFPVLAWAAGYEAALDKKVQQFVEKTYFERMDAYWTETVNLAKKHPTEKSFALAFLGLNEKHPDYDYFAKQLTENPIVVSKSGKTLTMKAGSDQFQITLGKKPGEILLNGNIVKRDFSRSLRQNVQDQMLKEVGAHNELWRLMVTPAFAGAGQFLGLTAALSAGGAAMGSIMGTLVVCVVGIGMKRPQDNIAEACAGEFSKSGEYIAITSKAGAAVGAIVPSGVAVVDFIAEGGLARSAFRTGAGILFLLTSTYQLVDVNAALIKCEDSDGYRFVSKAWGAEKNEALIFESEGKTKASFRGRVESVDINWEEDFKKMFPNLTAGQLKAEIKRFQDAHTARMAYCKKNPNGVYREGNQHLPAVKLMQKATR